MKRLRMLLTALCAAALTAASACAADESESIVDKETLRIGVPRNFPLIGTVDPNGVHEGFDIQVAEYLAEYLGAEPEFVPLEQADREDYLLDDRVDMVVSAFSITPERQQRIDFAGPYVLESFDVMVRGDNASITTLDDLSGKVLCKVTGSSVFERIETEHGIDVTPAEVETYSDCLDGLDAGDVDAIATDEFILAGLKDSRPDLELDILGIRFSSERIGVGLQPGDTAGCEAINRAIAQMYRDGVMQRLLVEWFSGAGLDVANPPIPQFEGCA